MKASSKLLCTLLVAAFCAVSFAQVPIQKSTEKVRINGKVYYIHVVKKGQTLYSLSKAYEVTIQQITESNAGLPEGLKEWQSIKIPVAPDATGVPAKTAEHTPKPEPAPPAATPAPKEPDGNTPQEKPRRPEYHFVKPGDTLPVIAARYGTTEAALRQLNPEAFFKGKLQSGTLLQIPPATDLQTLLVAAGVPAAADTAVARPAPEMPEHPHADTSLYHTVQPKETLWSIAKKHHTTVQELRRLNPGAFVNEELQAGAVLQLHAIMESPAETPAYLDLQAAPAVSPPAVPLPVKAALMLPLLRDIDDTLTARSKSPDNFFSFYEGALLAIEHLKQEGLSLELSVYDSFYEKDMETVLQQKNLPHQDIIIGPVYAGSLKPVAQFAAAHQIYIVSPLDPNAEALTIGNPYVLQLSPPAYCRQKKLIDHVRAQKHANIILIYHDNGKDTLMVQEYKQLLGDLADSVKMFAHQVVKGTAVRDTLEQLLVEEKMNCILVASNDDALVSDIAANLYLFTFRNRYDITLYGTERWRNFETVDVKYLHALNLHLVVPFFIDYAAEQVQKFVSDFYEQYKTEPSQYAFQGYDTFTYFLRAVMRCGKNLEPCLAADAPPLLQTKYRFKHNGDYANGLVNVESCLIHYTPDYSIEKQ